MKNLTLLVATILFSLVVNAQTADVKKDEILSDGKAIAKIERDGCRALSPTCNFYIRNFEGEPLITVIALDMIDPLQANVGNPEGLVRFLRFSFAGINGVAEIRNPAMLATKSKDVAQSIVKARLIKDGKLDEEAVMNFIQAHGERYTDRQREINPQIIIIDDGRR